jgi:acyl-coenzyme A synthetase/AMP-(fatty) acid ligase
VDGVSVTLGPIDGEEADDRGVVTVTSPAAAIGYYPQPSPELGGGRFVTSDVGRLVDGELVLLGRADDVINVRGKKVNPSEVEEVLGRLEGVEEAVVLGVPLAAGGEMVRAVIACPGRDLDRERVVGWCRASLASHKVPRSLILVDEIPRNARGKVDRVALRALEPGSPNSG